MTGPRTCMALAAVAATLSASCGAGDGGIDAYCSMSMSVSPASPEVGDTVQLAALVNREGISGAHSYSWSVRFGSETVVQQMAAADNSVITFVAGQAGIYSLSLAGSVGSLGCSGDNRDINVTVPGANFASYLLRVTPEAGTLAPTQDLLVSIAGGSPEFALGSVSLSPGAEVSLTLVGPSAEPLAGYVRARDLAAAEPPLYREAYSADGDLSLQLSGAGHDVLVMPADPTVAPNLWSDVTASSIGSQLDLGGGIAITGSVSGPGGAAVEGAQVMVEVAGVPSTVATTDSAGNYSLMARPGQGVAVYVVPAAGSGLPTLELEPGQDSLADATVIDVSYDPGLTSRVIAPDIRYSNGTTAAGLARVTFVARPIEDAGVITIAGAARSAVGTARLTSSADGSGQMAALTVVEAMYDVIIEPAPSTPTTEAARMQLVDLTSASPTQLLLAQPARYTGVIQNSGGQPLAGVAIRARPLGNFGAATSAGGQAISASDGSFTVATVSADHEIVIDGHPIGHTRLHLAGGVLPTGGQSQLGTITLPDSLSVTGRLTVAGGAVASRAHLAFYCEDCGTAGQPAMIAEGQSDAAGNFTVRLPDPGVSP